MWATPCPAPDLAHVTTRSIPLCPTLRRGKNGKAPTLRTSYHAHRPSRATTSAFRGAPYKPGQDCLLASRLLGTTKSVVQLAKSRCRRWRCRSQMRGPSPDSLTACEVVANNAFGQGRLCTDTEALRPAAEPMDGVLTAPHYYFVIDGNGTI